MLKTILLVGAGSFAGGVARHLLSTAIQAGCRSAFPWGTMAVNITGCMVIGLLYGIFERHNIGDTGIRLLLVTGFCGGFTTFSTFANESHAMLGGNNFTGAVLYTSLSILLGLAAVHIGHILVKTF